jgi:hypothetical protein
MRQPRSKAVPREPSIPAIGHNSREPLTDAQQHALHIDWLKKYRGALDLKKASDEQFKRVCKAAKAELGPRGVDGLKLALHLETEEGEAEATEAMQNAVKVMRWSGVPLGTMNDLFAAPQVEPDQRAVNAQRLKGLKKKLPDGEVGDASS